MKILLRVKPHSFVDVITNSSTELFTCNTNKSVEMVEELLKELLNTYNKLKDSNLSFENTFIVKIYTEENFNSDYNPNDDFQYGCEDKANIGKIFIYSNGDNAIPYALYDIIEEAFNAERYHLG